MDISRNMHVSDVLLFYDVSTRRLQTAVGQNSDRHHSEGKDSESAIDILKKRYAKGEITKEEFDQMKNDL